MKTIGKRIKQLRKERGHSMAILGKAIGTDSANISNWESDKRIPGGRFIVALSEHFNVSTDWILKGTTVAKIDYSGNFLVTDASQLQTEITNLSMKDQHFIHAFVEFYRNYTIHMNQQEKILQKQFTFLPLLKQTIVNEAILSDENIVTHLPIPVSLAKEGDFLYSSSYNQNQLETKKTTELAIIKKQTDAASGQTVLATYDKQLIMCKLIKREDALILQAIDSDDNIDIVNEKEIQIHGLVTSLYNSSSTCPS
ncbi:helix-turn-helix domain-containing protein [Paraliobacillus sp. JSM ZJ581]|uniref:helix-turn-helix domain-containing protein n=1 Tax=Paraliobacillus sp. JSM ZJ581 TaxID=3342118 RepID=UPI0035A94922